MQLSGKHHFFQIDENLYGGEEPPYQPEFDLQENLGNQEIQRMSHDFQELLGNFQVFIDLREEDEPYYEYKDSLPEGIVYERVPIMDIGTPESPEQIHPLICRISSYLESGSRVYLHCHGGRGRTGTVAGCWLAFRYYLTGRQALHELKSRFADSLKGRKKMRCPETPEQVHFILEYTEWLQTKKWKTGNLELKFDKLV